jgi:hypothetical protein
MDLASGYSDSTNYGNGYTPLATGAINNNNANYAANQEYARLMGQYNPFAQSGGFGNMTDYYSGLGAAYGRATGGFNGTAPGWADPQPQEQPAPQGDPYQNWLQSGGGASFNDRFSAAPAITPGLQPQGGDYSAFPNAISAGVDPSANVKTGNSSYNSRFGAWPEQPSPATGIPIMNQGDDGRDQLAQQMSGASFNDRFGNLPGQPYGQGYFDNTFGSVANTGGTIQQPYQGNPFYMPQPMPAQQAVPQGGGLGAQGFGPYGGSTYTGQPGFGLGVGQIGQPGANIYGADPSWSGDQKKGGALFGYGGLTDQPQPGPVWQPSS